MSSFKSWMDALGKRESDYKKHSTPETYQRIRDLGLDTLEWICFDQIDSSNLESILQQITGFVDTKKPCLFIFDPKSPNYRKDWLFGVRDASEIRNWLQRNLAILPEYSFLLTTQVTNPGNGFVGSVFSDGEGTIFCETYHEPNVEDQAMISRGKRGDCSAKSEYFHRFATEDYAVNFVDGNLLLPDLARKIIEMYGSRRGYFEFIYGEHLGKRGIFTSGFENTEFVMRTMDSISAQMKSMDAITEDLTFFLKASWYNLAMRTS